MGDVAIRVEGLGKQYQLGGPQARYTTIRDQIRKWTSLQTLLRWGRSVESNAPFWALKDVSFEVKRGEVVGIIGRNGAGKSTLLKILSRITEPTEGEVDLCGRVGSLLEVGTGFHPELTGRENIYLNGAILGMRRTEIVQKLAEIVAFAEIEKFIDTPVKHFSSGMYMRLAFAVAAHLEPEILIIDEVLAVGDVAFQKKCLGKLDDVARSGRTVLFVSHNLQVVQAICSRACVLHEGRLKFVGPVTVALNAYEAINPGDPIDYRKVTNRLGWRGLLNREELDELSPIDDIRFSLGFESGAMSIESMDLDLALTNERGERVIHTRSRFVTQGLSVPAHTRFKIDYRICSPRLCAGRYKLTVFASIGSDILFWGENIDGPNILAKAYFGTVEFFDNIQAAIIPEFSIKLIKD